jgi:asparagine synthase (glutamine-hydrolysing)
MCGIVAMFSMRSPLAPESLEIATKSLRHRGPDGQRYWMSPDRRVGLGHARLSIIDLATGDQPIANENEKLRIIVNGELYGYEAIQKELEAAGHVLRTRSDSEIALHLYEDLGAHCLQQLRGEFAIVLWDEVNRTLFAARDRFGIKPLFYAYHQDTLYLASEVKALFAAGVPARWDDAAVYSSLEFVGPHAGTLFKGIFQVPPGHYMTATEGQIQLKRYWDFNYPLAANAIPERSDAEYQEEFRSVLEESVRIRLRADVTVGCYLSGGIDSCAILGLAARHHPEPIHAFTIAFDRPEFDESAVAREMASKFGAQFCSIPVRQDEIAEHLADAIVQAETFVANSHGAAKYLLSRAVRDAGFKVVLTGEGSDEILGGYTHFRRDMAPSNGNRSVRVPAAQPGVIPPSFASNGDAAAIAVKRLLGFVPGWIQSSLAQSAKIRPLLAQGFAETFEGKQGFRSFFNDLDVAGQLAGREPLHQSLYLWSKTRLPNYLLSVLGDRMEMAHSIEGRVPFLDHHLVEVMRRQPVTQKIRGTSHKYVLRESMRDLLTDTVYRRPKQPFWSPQAMLDPKGRFSVFLQDTLRGPFMRSMPFFDAKKVIELLDGFSKDGGSSAVANDEVLMSVLSACVLQERFKLSEG